MQTTEIKYAIMDRVTGKLLAYYKAPSGVHYIDNNQTLSTWYVEDVETAYSVMDGHSLSQITGWCPAHCQTKIIDVLNRAKRSLVED